MYLHSASRCTDSSRMAMHEVGVQCTPYNVIAYRDTNIRHEPARRVSRPHEHYRYISSLVYCVSCAFHFILYGTSSWFTEYPHEERRCRILRPLLASNVSFLRAFCLSLSWVFVTLLRALLSSLPRARVLLVTFSLSVGYGEKKKATNTGEERKDEEERLWLDPRQPPLA